MRDTLRGTVNMQIKAEEQAGATPSYSTYRINNKGISREGTHHWNSKFTVSKYIASHMSLVEEVVWKMRT